MSWFRNLRISVKLLAIFGIFIVLFVVFGSVGYNGMAKINNNVKDQALVQLPSAQALLIIQDEIATIHASERTLAMAGLLQSQRQAEYETIDASIKNMKSAIDSYGPLALTTREKEAWQAFLKLEQAWMNRIEAYLKASRELDAIDPNRVLDRQDKYKELQADTIQGNVEAYAAACKALDEMVTRQKDESAASYAASQRFTGGYLIGLIGAMAAAIAAVVVLATLFARSISRPIGKLVDSANRLANGDMDIRLDFRSKDEIGQLGEAFGHMASAIAKLTSDINTLVNAAREGTLDSQVDVSKHRGEYRKITEGFNDALQAIAAPVAEAITVLQGVAQSDLTVKMETGHRGDMKAMADALNTTIDALLDIQTTFIRLSQGDLSQMEEFERIGKRCENDRMTPAVLKTMHTLDTLIADAYGLSQAAADGKLDARVDPAKYEGKYSQLIAGINGLIDAITAPLAEAIQVLRLVSHNDFTGGMSGQYSGSFAEFSASINSLLQTLNEMLGDINSTAEQVASGTAQVSDGAQALSQGAAEQASAIEELTASVADIAAQTKQNAMNATRASELAVAARDSAAEGSVRMTELRQAMAEINGASTNISKIIKVIDDIAFQTNLLALNAAVEAARAGQHGKGFAVVAEEVRNLAQRSASAAKETTDMIEGSVRKAQAGTRIVGETAEALDRIVRGVEKATELVEGIARASGEQASAVSQVNRGIEQVSQVTQTNSATAEESAATSEELSGQATLLKELVDRFTLRGQTTGTAARLVVPAHAAAQLPLRAPVKPQISMGPGEFGKY